MAEFRRMAGGSRAPVKPGGRAAPGAWTRLGRVWTHARVVGPIDALRCTLMSLLFHARPDESAFDREHGTETRSVFGVRFDEQPAPGQVVRSGATLPFVLRRIVTSLDADPRNLTFVDFGSGKGRALLCAAAFPFARMVGVEWSTDLCEVARRNIDIFRARHPSTPPIEVRCMNVLDFEMPAGPLVVYVYNPFGPTLTRQVVDKIGRHARTSSSRCLVAYAGLDDPQFDFVLGCFADAGLRVVRECRTLDLQSSWVLGEGGAR
jgi:predicted RNA methylase